MLHAAKQRMYMSTGLFKGGTQATTATERRNIIIISSSSSSS
eukprot:COSAG05_NODE_15931_length_357_cov_1.406977_1_plen_41_part_01